MSGPTYQPGEIVDITIKGVRVGHEGGDSGWLHFFLGVTPHRVMLDRPEVTVERTVFDPQPGDLWQDRNGGLYFVTVAHDGALTMRSPDAHTYAPADFIADAYGPMTRIYRQDGTR